VKEYETVLMRQIHAQPQYVFVHVPCFLVFVSRLVCEVSMISWEGAWWYPYTQGRLCQQCSLLRHRVSYHAHSRGQTMTHD